jgi:hypothetical protein
MVLFKRESSFFAWPKHVEKALAGFTWFDVD